MTDLFNRKDLIGDQSINTINNFNDYIDSLLNPFNNILTDLILELNSISINRPVQYKDLLVTNLQVKNEQLLSKYNLINISSQISTDVATYIGTLTTSKNNFNSILNSKASPTFPLTRPITTTILDNSTSYITKQYVTNNLIKYTLPTPVPSTKLYVNESGTGYIWA